MVCTYSLCFGVIAVVLLYKLLDYLIRIPRIGDYASRHVFVTGCDTGFGNLLAKRLDALGCHVFAGCLTEAGEVELKKACSSRLKTVPLNVTQPESVRKAYDFVVDSLPKGKGLWGLMNNAGVCGCVGRIEWTSPDDYKAVTSVNTVGLIDVSLTFLPLLKQSKGRIANTTSLMGRYALDGSTAPYCVSKYASEGFSDCLRRQLRAYKVKVMLIEPGLFKTNIMTSELLETTAHKLWNGLSPALKKEFGEDYIRKTVQTYLKIVDYQSERLTDVVDAYEHALLGRFPRARYVVGTDSKYLWLPLQWLPEWLGDFILDKLISAPISAVLK